jgi:ribonuclease VapC
VARELRRELVVDSSALIAMLLDEPQAAALLSAALGADTCWVSAFNLLETSIVITARKGPAGRLALDSLLQVLGVEAIPLTAEHVLLARTAWQTYGKGNHAAGLNIGDCCAYALSRYAGFPLLAVGTDFPQTDVELALLG